MSEFKHKYSADEDLVRYRMHMTVSRLIHTWTMDMEDDVLVERDEKYFFLDQEMYNGDDRYVFLLVKSEDYDFREREKRWESTTVIIMMVIAMIFGGLLGVIAERVIG